MQLFDELIVAIAPSEAKHPLFPFDERITLMQRSVDLIANTEGRVRVIGFEGLLADLIRRENAHAILRGLRAVSDFEFEFQMALMNRRLVHEAETVFLMPALSWVYLSSSIVKNVARHGGDITGLVPDHVRDAIYARVGRDS